MAPPPEAMPKANFKSQAQILHAKKTAGAGGRVAARVARQYSQIFEGAGCSDVPAFGLRRAARCSRHRGGSVGKGLPRLVNRDLSSLLDPDTTSDNAIGFACPALRPGNTTHRARLPESQCLPLRLRGQTAMIDQIGHLHEIIGAAIPALPQFHGHEQIGP
jgi:hypothetical protein